MAAPYYVYGSNLESAREKYTSVVNAHKGSEIVQKRYFSSIDTDVYFGNLLIDEMVAFDFMIEEKKMPIYGYNNYSPKRILIGQKVIQGSFAINFTQTFELKRILASIEDSIYANGYEETEFYCGDDNKAIFDKGFDITISYGDAKGEGSYNACTQTLVGCYITSYRQAFDTSGEPILDMYTFIAKDLLINTESESSVEVKNTTEPSNNWTTKKADSSESYVIANTKIEKEYNDLCNYCKEHPDTLGIVIDPMYNYVNGVSRIELFITTNDQSTLDIEEITIEITDVGLGAGGTTVFKLDKKANEYNYYCELKGTTANIGKKIKQYFQNDNEHLDCTVYIRRDGTKEPLNMEHKTELHCAYESYLG